MISSRLAIPSIVYVTVLAVAVPYFIVILQSYRNDFVFLAFVVSITTWGNVGILKYLCHVASLRFPGPVPLPFIGNCLSLIQKGNIQESIRQLKKTYGSIIDLLLIEGNRVVLITNPSFCRTACKSTDRGDLHGKDWKNNFRDRFIWQDLSGFQGLDLFTRTGDIFDWASHRKFLQPAFDQKHVRAMTSKVEMIAQDLVQKLPVGEPFDIMPYFQNYGLEMIHVTALGQTVATLEDRGRGLVEVFDTSMQLFTQYQFDPFLFWSVKLLPYIGLNPKELRNRKNVSQFRQYCRGLLDKELHRQKLGYNDETGVDNLLSIMVSGLSDNFGIENLLDELWSFIFAGFDTSAVTLSVLMNHLATNTECQKKVHEELDSLKGDLSYAEMSMEMPYLAACIRESQRLQPIAPLLQRRLQEDIPMALSDDDGNNNSITIIPKGTVALIPSFLLHRDEKEYPNPESFHPERWIDKTTGRLISPKPGYFYAFGSGPKMCIGFQLAERVVKMAAIAVLQKYRVESRANIKIVDLFVTKPQSVVVELKER